MTANDFLPLRKFPIGIQSFEKLRNDEFLYVDKSADVYRMATYGRAYFLGRPRRFGKSLLLSTLEAYFLGKKHLFKGLAIEQWEKDWTVYPVLHMDLNARNYINGNSLTEMLNQYLEKWEAEYGDEKKDRQPEERFAYIIEKIYRTTGKQVVVLVDEYDKPMLQAIGNDALGDEYRNMLKAFYGVLKSADPYLRFVFLTGVTKFGQVSVFSDLNQLKDISMDERYATICGITDEEMEANFRPDMERLAKKMNVAYENIRDRMRRTYDGYQFCQNSEGVYNPFSVLNALDSQEFSYYWFATGTPTFLVELLKGSDYDLRDLEGVEVTANQFADYRAKVEDPVPVIYQSGYLTVKKYDEEFQLYKLGFPNEEVKYGFLSFLTPFYTNVSKEESVFYIGKFVRELRSGDAEAFLTRLRAFFADFPYELNDKTERHYQVVFYLVFKLMGQFADVEVRSARGRADAVVKTSDYIYVFEFKLNGTVSDALRQIDEKGYLIPYTADSRKLVKVGVNFNAEERNLGDWEIIEV